MRDCRCESVDLSADRVTICAGQAGWTTRAACRISPFLSLLDSQTRDLALQGNVLSSVERVSAQDVGYDCLRVRGEPWQI